MDISAIIRKAVQGDSLAEPEKTALLAFADGNPGAESDGVRTDFETQIARLRDALTQTGAARDAAASELQSLKRRHCVEILARDAGFEDPGYLEYLFSCRNIDPADENTVQAAMAELRQSSPKLFNIPLKSGSGSVPSAEPRIPAAYGSAGVAELLQHAPEIIG